MEVKLTNSADVALVDKSDYTLVADRAWRKSVDGYAISGRTLMHRLVNATPDGMDTDHINHDRLDNRRDNLRSCSHAVNMKNTKRFGSVHFESARGKWMARHQQDNGKRVFIGRFNSKLEALSAIGA